MKADQTETEVVVVIVVVAVGATTIAVASVVLIVWYCCCCFNYQAALHYYVDVSHCYRRSSVVCLSVGLSVMIVNPANTAEPI